MILLLQQSVMHMPDLIGHNPYAVGVNLSPLFQMRILVNGQWIVMVALTKRP